MGFLFSLGSSEQDEGNLVPDFHHPGISMDNKERSTALFKAINMLPEKQKTAYVLNKLEGMSYRDISEVMETTVSAVESLLSRANANLRKELESFYRSH